MAVVIATAEPIRKKSKRTVSNGFTI